MTPLSRTWNLPAAAAEPNAALPHCSGERTPMRRRPSRVNYRAIVWNVVPGVTRDMARYPRPSLVIKPWLRLRPTARWMSTCAGDRGSASIQLMILLPVMFLAMFTAMQAALYYHARAIAIAAAQEGAREAGSESGSRDSGVGVAKNFITQAGGSDALTSADVSASRSATIATVTVTGTSLSVIPGWNVTITQSSSVPVERLTQ